MKKIHLLLCTSAFIWLGADGAFARPIMEGSEQELLSRYELSEKERGPTDESTLDALWALAEFYRRSARLDEATPYYDKIVRARSANQPLWLMKEKESTLGRLLDFYENQKQFDKAASLLDLLIKSNLKIGLRKHNSIILEGLQKLGELRHMQGSIEQAKEVYKNLVDSLQDDPSSDFGRVFRPDKIKYSRATANFYVQIKDFSEAQQLLEQALALSQSYDDNNEDDIAIELAQVYLAQKQSSKAEDLYLRTITKIDRETGRKHPMTVQLRTNLAILYEANGRNDEARTLRTEATDIQKNMPSREESFRQATLNAARLFAKQGEVGPAVALYKSIIGDSELPENHPARNAAEQELRALVGRQ